MSVRFALRFIVSLSRYAFDSQAMKLGSQINYGIQAILKNSLGIIYNFTFEQITVVFYVFVTHHQDHEVNVPDEITETMILALDQILLDPRIIDSEVIDTLL